MTLLIFGYGCQSSSTITNNNFMASPVCSEQPSLELKRDDVTEVSLGKTPIIKSGKLASGTTQGFIFSAKVGQTLIYQVNEDSCTWIFTPNNQLLLENNVELDQEGTYIVQITPKSGDQDFELSLTLESPQSPEEFIEIYYNNINNSNYSDSWQLLTNEFKRNLDYQDYRNWWNRVRTVDIDGIYTLDQTEETALVKVNLQYRMSNGNLVQDRKPYFHLAWDREGSHWLISKKTIDK